MYPKKYWPGEGDFAHLEFAWRYEGLHLALLRVLLPRFAPEAVESYVQSKPTSGYARRLWFLYEKFTGAKLNLADVTQGGYVPLLDPVRYFTGTRMRSPRHRVDLNLLGTLEFSPMVRRTSALDAWEEKRLDQRCRETLATIPAEIYDRALHFLYTKETKSSYAIERETPDQKRSQRFIAALRDASQHDYLQEKALVDLQRAIVDPRFANDGYRDSIGEQNYVGTSLAPGEEQVHFVAPKPDDLRELMNGFFDASRHVLTSEVPPVVAAAVVAYPFVFLHPFSDGNGRIHRFLIHYVLSHRRFAPLGVVFPVSAAMLHQRQAYDRSLEAFSRPAMPLIDYELDAHGRLTVLNPTADLYRYIDCTSMAEALFGFVEETIENELPAEIRFLQRYDLARRRMREIVDLPNRHADLFVRLCLQNNGRFSDSKRKLPELVQLTEPEIEALEIAVTESFELTAETSSEALENL